MADFELAQMELLSQVDDLIAGVKSWAGEELSWGPHQQCRSLLSRVLERADQVRVRVESPLVVATFGGTGTGKSTLVNALVGTELTESGRQRPTTMRPIVLAHPKTMLDATGLPLDQVEVRRIETPILRDFVLVDCPDPDTTESEDQSEASNLERLRRLLPHCDVLIYTTTQQKYRSARVADELQQAAGGCRLVFVQTHAGLDSDIRADWAEQLNPEFDVPDLFFVDSVRALEEQRDGRRPSGDFGRLQDLLREELSASQRVRIRRANLLDLLESALVRCREILDAAEPKRTELQTALEDQRRQVTHSMAGRLQRELRESRGLWQRRLLNTATDCWGVSPFSIMLRLYNGLGGMLASFTFLRARSTAQMALVGMTAAAKKLRDASAESKADSRLERLGSFALSDAELREAQIVVQGYAQAAEVDYGEIQSADLQQLRTQAADVEARFLGDAGQQVDRIIDELARQNTGWFTKARYEFAFLAYLGFVLYRMGKNFFWDSFLAKHLSDAEPGPLLSTDFYLPALLFFLAWTLLLIMLFGRRLGRGLANRINDMAEQLAGQRLAHGLFPKLDQMCDHMAAARTQLEGLAKRATRLREELAVSDRLGGQTS